METKPYVWQMIKEAMTEFGGKAVTYKEIKGFIAKKYGNVNPGTINCQIIICSVNQPSRVHYPENTKPRIVDGNCQYDFLYSVDRGKVEFYNPPKHGIWEIAQEDTGRLIVRKKDDYDDFPDAPNVIAVDGTKTPDNNFTFGLESQLRDFIALNLSLINSDLQLYVSDDGIDGIEYRTAVGVIDILAQDKNEDFIVFELKLSRGPDAALGQLQRYMGWVKSNMADGKSVRGIIIAKVICDKLKYAVSITENISLFEYKVNFDISKVGELAK